MGQGYAHGRMPRALSVVLLIMLVLGASLVAEPRPALAGGTVGTGTPESCDEDALDAALASGGDIDFDCGAEPHTITVTSTKTILAPTTIDGGNLITISGGDSVRIFDIDGQSLTLRDITLTAGRASADFSVGEFGHGAAIRNLGGSVVLDHVTITDSHAARSGCSIIACTGNGGAIFSSGTLTVENNSTITGNSATVGGAIHNVWGSVKVEDSVIAGNFGASSAGGIYNDHGSVSLTRTVVDENSGYGSSGGIATFNGSLIVTDSEITNNAATASVGFGGGIYVVNSSVTITGSTIAGNVANLDGAGLYISDSGPGVTIAGSTIANNSAGLRGGGILNIGILSITNSTISGNSALNGGGIYNYRDSGTAFPPPSEATLTHVTITNNVSDNGAGLRREGGLVKLTGTLIAGNSGVDCTQAAVFPGLEIDSLGHNLDGDGSCALDQETDVVAGAANLAPLADNGGNGMTHMLRGGSQAVDAGAEDCGLTEDQRGVSRPQGAACDIGAVEITNAAPSVSSVAASLPTVDEGGASTISVMATDPEDDDDDTLSYAFDCDGNGHYEVGPQPEPAYECAFPDDVGDGASNSVTVNVLVSDPYGATASGSVDVNVNNFAPELSGLSGATIDENQTATISGDISDPGELDTFTLTIDWGDGSQPEVIDLPAGSDNFTRSHQYLDGTNTYGVTVTIEDKDGDSDSVSVNIEVNNVAPTVNLVSALELNEGDPLAVTGTFSDPGSLDTHTATVDYGDGDGPQLLALNVDGSFSISYGPYPDDRLQTIDVCVSDGEDEGCGQLVVTVLNVPPKIDGIETTRDGNTLTIVVTASDPGELDTLTYGFDCDNDGDFEIEGPVNQSVCTLDVGAHVTTIGVRVSDDDQGVTFDSVSIQQSVVLCANTYTGEVRAPLYNGSCAGVMKPLELPGDNSVTLCVHQYTGAVAWYQHQTCSGVQWPHVIPNDGPLPYCANLSTGNVRANLRGAPCSNVERAGVIPGQ